MIRIALCQLEAHPALRIDDRDFLGEPFRPSSASPTLAELARHSIDIAAARRECQKRYVEWAGNRIRLIFDWLSQLIGPPHVVVFPEGAIPPTELHFAKAFALDHDAIVFAGTHTFNLNSTTEKLYKSLGIGRSNRKYLEGERDSPWNVLPVFSRNGSAFHLKRRSAVFEQTDIASPALSETPTIQCMEFDIRGIKLSVLPLVCAEALQNHNITGQPDLAVICAYNKSIDDFMPFIELEIRNKIPVTFCNDGQFGQSGVFAPIDKRMANWWWSAPIEGRMPPGDGLLIVDVDLANRSPQVSVANPLPTLLLRSIVAVVGEQGATSPIRIAAALPDIAGRRDATVQESLLGELLQREAPTAIQGVKLRHLRSLAGNGTVAEWWKVLGVDCVLSQLPDIQTLEASLAAACLPLLDATLNSLVIKDDATIGKVHRLAQACRTAAGSTKAVPLIPQEKAAPLDREAETSQLRALLDNKAIKLIIVSGLEGVGKNTLVDLALRQSGRTAKHSIELTTDITPDFLVATLLRLVQLPDAQAYAADILDLPSFRQRLQHGLIVCITDALYFQNHGNWRDNRFPSLLLALSRALANIGGKLILQSSRQLTIDNAVAGEVGRLPLRGLDTDNGVALLDQHLRRVGLDPIQFNREDRRLIVDCLAGHPGAIILASEFIFEEGMRAVIADLRDRKGIHARIVRLVLTKCEFTEEEQMVLSVLDGIRVPIPAMLLDDIVEFPAVPVAMELWRTSVVDRVRDDEIAISSLVRGFADISRCSPVRFERANDVLSEYFAQSAQKGNGAEHLRWAAESRYHAALAGRFSFARELTPLADGVLGALLEKVRAHDYQGARPLVDGLLHTYRTGEVCQEAAIVYARLGDLDSALTLAKEALSKESSRTWALTQVGNIALHFHREEIAEDAVRIIKASGHDNAYLAVLEGRICLRRDDQEGAIKAFRRGTEIAEMDRRDCWPFLHLGRELIKKGEINEAIDVLFRGETLETERSRRNRKGLVAIRTQLAIAHLMVPDLTNAERYLKLVLDEDRGNPEVARANVLFKAIAGVEDFTTAVAKELDPSRARHRFERSQIHLYRGLFFLNTGNREKASEEFSLAHHADPQNVFVLLRWCETLIDIGQELHSDREFEASRMCAEQAKTTAEKVLEFDKDNAKARALLERISDLFNVQ